MVANLQSNPVAAIAAIDSFSQTQHDLVCSESWPFHPVGAGMGLGGHDFHMPNQTTHSSHSIDGCRGMAEMVAYW